MMVLPLPAFILDLLFTFNIALSIMVLLVAMFTQRTLEFAAFSDHSVVSSLLRLALNVASTRYHFDGRAYRRGGGWEGGQAFGHFLVGGNFAMVSWCLSFSDDVGFDLWSLPKVPGVSQKWVRALFSMVCRVSRWQLTPGARTLD
ncbi:FHIPEP family type III secretion protein [Escherichia coli]